MSGLHSTLHSFVTLFWPKKVKAGKLEEIHAKMVMKEASAEPGASKKPRTSLPNPKTNGSAVPVSGQSSSVKVNGKSYR